MHPDFSMNSKRGLPYFFLALGLSAVIALSVSTADAARVEKVKGKQVLIDSEGLPMSKGEKYFIIIDGKKKGVVKITKVKSERALGTLTKGRAEVDAMVEPTGRSSKSDSAFSDDDILKGKKRKKKKSRKDDGDGDGEDTTPQTIVGFLVGYAMDSQSATVASYDGSGNVVSTTKESFSGSGYSLKGFGDIPLSESFGVISRAGIEQLNLSSGSNNSSIMYLTADILLRYSFGSGGFVPYAAAGMGIHFPISKSSTYLDVPRISSTTIFFFDGGFNWAWGETSYLVGALEYAMFPPSNDVSTSFITGRFGMGWRW